MYRFSFFLFCIIFLTNNAQAQKYYEVSTIDSAQVKVFAVDKPEQADLLVFFVYEAKDVTKVGYWMQVSTKKEANMLLIFVDAEKDSNIKICLVDSPDQAGLKNESKKELFKLE